MTVPIYMPRLDRCIGCLPRSDGPIIVSPDLIRQMRERGDFCGACSSEYDRREMLAQEARREARAILGDVDLASFSGDAFRGVDRPRPQNV